VEQVSWYDALVFCNKLSIMEGLAPAYRISGSTNPADWGAVPTSSNSKWDAVEIIGATGYRLPTEAQWEYAAKGGNPNAADWVGYTYAGSDDPDAVAWYSSNSGSKTHEVGKKAPNGLELYDMSGNVWEWCWDWWNYYTSDAQTDPGGPVSPVSGAYRVIRGGYWYNSAGYVRSAYRGSDYPYWYGDSVGFRLVRP
jgi:formylglycine-generating enzyme required for sulfatase activity